MATSLKMREKKAEVDRWEGRRETPGDVEKLRDIELAKAKALLTRAEAEKRDLTTDENELHELLMDKVEALNERMKELMRGPAWNVGTRQVPPEPTHFEREARSRRMGGSNGKVGRAVQDVRGNEVRLLSREDSLTDFVVERNQRDLSYGVSFGEIVRALATGDQRSLGSEFRTAQGEAVATQGGYTVPDQHLAEVIDLARANSVVFKAGATVIPLESDVCTIARIAADPTISIKGENSAFSETAAVFDAITLVPKLFGCLIRCSRELAEDGVNFVEAVTNAMAKSLAAEIDRQCLVGTSSAQLAGLKVMTGVGSVTSVGSPANYTKWLDGIQAVWEANGVPNAYVLAPRDAASLFGLQAATSDVYMIPPEPIRELTRFITSALPTNEGAGVNESSSYLGDFKQMVIGLRNGARIEVSSEEGDSFAKHQLALKVTMRVDVNAFHPNHFVRISGILA